MAHVLLGVTGSVAAIKVPELVEGLAAQHDVRIVATKSSTYFFDTAPFHSQLTLDRDEWPGERYERGDPIRHIELRNWADLFLIAPLDANTLAKMAHGLCDNALTSVFRAWDFAKPLIVAPAMNTLMWTNPWTRRHLDLLEQVLPPGQFCVLSPIVKTLACGEDGLGAMAEVNAIVRNVNGRFR